MTDEVELKLKVADIAGVRDRLRSAGAQPRGTRFETNAFFDTPDRALKARGDGLRLRTMADAAGVVSAVVTYKGPATGDEVRRREEIEFAVGDVCAAEAFLTKLGYGPTVSFEKRRETWELDGCLVELDDVARLGTFVEIEGDTEAAVQAVRKRLGLEFEPAVVKGYASMVSALVAADPSLGGRLRF